MKKKKSLKQIREEQNAARLKMIKEAAAQKAASSPAPVSSDISSSSEQTDEKNTKTSSKAAGLKSSFIVGDKVIMTSFGRGNDAVLEHEIASDESITPLTSHNALNDVKLCEKGQISFHGRLDKSVTTDNPAYKAEKPAGQDLLCLKDKLETHYFGRIFDDNIHMQLIYKILDLEKILAIHTNNAVFAVLNTLGETEYESTDFIGAGGKRSTVSYEEFMTKNSYADFSNFIKRNELIYFGSTFYSNDKLRNEKDIYHIVALLSSLRQFCFHSDFKEDHTNYIKGDWLYKLDSELTADFKSTLDMLYKENTESVDSSFLVTNNINLHILCKLINDEPDTIVREYYDFVIKKVYKNMGFSILKIREKMLEQSPLTKYKDDDYNSVRSKLYRLFDFMIWKYCSRHVDWVDSIINNLRKCMNDVQKDMVYEKAARGLVSEFTDSFASAADLMPEIKDFKKEQCYKTSINDICVSNLPVSYFSKLTYMICMLLDSKEINDLLTSFINAFENIVSFEETLDQLQIDCTFTDDYSFFNYENCRSISDELRIVNSFARMQKFDPKNATNLMYRDALRILGCKTEMTDEDLDAELDKIIQFNDEGKLIKNSWTPFYNFITNNVIKSSMFLYLVRYSNPRKVREMADNPKIIRFVLSGIPEKQIDRYYLLCKNSSTPSCFNTDEKIDALTSVISGINYEQFEDVPKSTKVGKHDPYQISGDGRIKQRYQSIVSLYLTVMYLVVKNLVYVNSRYVMAFHALERDAYHHYGESLDMNKSKDYRALTKKLLDDENYIKYGHFKNKRWKGHIDNNMLKSDKGAVISFRNIVAHLGVIRNGNEYACDIAEINSYFELYHYIMQNLIKEDKIRKPENKKQEGYAEAISGGYISAMERNHSYCKDFVKAYCIPFAYSLPRYKNLSIDVLFDRNHPAEKAPKDQ